MQIRTGEEIGVVWRLLCIFVSVLILDRQILLNFNRYM
jgi:hypothetical protein